MLRLTEEHLIIPIKVSFSSRKQELSPSLKGPKSSIMSTQSMEFMSILSSFHPLQLISSIKYLLDRS